MAEMKVKVRIETDVIMDVGLMAKAFAHMPCDAQAKFLAIVHQEMETYTDGTDKELGSYGREMQMLSIKDRFGESPDAKEFIRTLYEMTHLDSEPGCVLPVHREATTEELLSAYKYSKKKLVDRGYDLVTSRTDLRHVDAVSMSYDDFAKKYFGDFGCNPDELPDGFNDKDIRSSVAIEKAAGYTRWPLRSCCATEVGETHTDACKAALAKSLAHEPIFIAPVRRVAAMVNATATRTGRTCCNTELGEQHMDDCRTAFEIKPYPMTTRTGRTKPLEVIWQKVDWPGLGERRVGQLGATYSTPRIICKCKVPLGHSYKVHDQVRLDVGPNMQEVGRVFEVHSDGTLTVVLDAPPPSLAYVPETTEQREAREKAIMSPGEILKQVDELVGIKPTEFIADKVFPKVAPAEAAGATCDECKGTGFWTNPAGGRNAKSPCSMGCKP